MSSGVRIKDQVVRNADLEEVRQEFTKAGFVVSDVARTARALVITSAATVKQCPDKVCGPYEFSIKISSSDSIEVRWQYLSPRDYYHIDAFHKDARSTLIDVARSVWFEYASKHVAE